MTVKAGKMAGIDLRFTVRSTNSITIVGVEHAWLSTIMHFVVYYDCTVSCISYYVITMSSISVCDFDLLCMRC